MFQHFQRKPEENNGMNQCIDTVTPEHLEDTDRNTEELRKERGEQVSVGECQHTHMPVHPLQKAAVPHSHI